MPKKKQVQKRLGRMTDYEPASKRRVKKYVHPDGTRMTESEILAQQAMAALKKFTTR
jgi:hypothetical protein